MNNLNTTKVQTAEKEEAILSSLYINPTKFCNLKCQHCWVDPPYKSKLNGLNGEMSMEELVKIVDKAKTLGLSSIKLTGGEPLLRKDIGELMDYCFNSGVEIMMESNGTLITKDMAKMLKKYNVNHISISMDSFQEELHDNFRGVKGAYKSTIKGINNLVEQGIHPQVIMSMYRENLENFVEFMELGKKLKVGSIKLNIIGDMGRGGDLKKDNKIPTVAELLKFYENFREWRKNYPFMLIFDIPIAFRHLEEIKGPGVSICSIKNIMGVLPTGEVSICGIGFVDKSIIFGNLKDDVDSMDEIWKTNDVLKSIREDIPGKLEGICGICALKGKCLGACRADAYNATGNIFAPFWFCQQAYDQGLFPKTRIIPEELRETYA